jgi:hypothetical protein
VRTAAMMELSSMAVLLLGPLVALTGSSSSSSSSVAAAVPPPPCPVATPSGFTPAAQHGWYATMPIPKPNEDQRHGVSVECCAAFCKADALCQGFEVYQPCGISDCYNFHTYNSTFTHNAGAYTFTRPRGSPAGPPAPLSCTPAPKLCDHPVILDDTKKIMPWSTNNATAGGGAGAYEYAARLAWAWFGAAPLQDSLPLWYFFGSFSVSSGKGDKWPSTPASMVDYVSRAASAWLAFTGDRTPFETQAVPLARYLLANGTTPADWRWSSMPYASSDPGALIYRGANSSRFGGCAPNVSGCRGDGIGHIVRKPPPRLHTACGSCCVHATCFLQHPAGCCCQRHAVGVNAAATHLLPSMYQSSPHRNLTKLLMRHGATPSSTTSRGT